MDIEIKNQEQVLSICQTVQNEKLKQLSNCISSLESNISSVKEKWSSTGIDKETYVIELEKQVENLRIIYQLLGGFSKTITNYTENVKRTAANTIGVGAGMAAVSGALAGASSLKGANSNSSGNGGGNFVSSAFSSIGDTIKDVAGSVNGMVNNVKDTALKATNSNGASSVGKNTSSNGNVGGANNKVDSGSIVGSTSIGGGSSYSGGGSSYSGGGSSYSGTPGSGYSSGYSSGLSSSDISSVHGSGAGIVSSGLGSDDGVVSTSNGMMGSVEDNSSAMDNIVNGFNESVGSVTASTSNLFTNNKLGAIVPKLTAPVGLNSATSKKTVPAVPVISGVAAAGVAGVGGVAFLNKKKDVEPTENLVIENWDEKTSNEQTEGVATMEQKLGELTFDDILG